MKLHALLQGYPYTIFYSTQAHNLESTEITRVCIDSRNVQPGDLFFAISGQQVDGHAFVQEAYKKGAIAAVVEKELPNIPILQIKVDSSTKALAKWAATFYGDPAKQLLLCAVTGTNGKTTTSFLIDSILKEAGHQTGILGTILYRYPGYEQQAPLTTPSSLEFHHLLSNMKNQGVTAVTLEASSHALALHRLDGVKFQVAAFTNLSQDHLDFHKTMEAYFQAKSLLFQKHLLPPEQGGKAVLFIDDAYGFQLAQDINPKQRMTISLAPFLNQQGPPTSSTKTDIPVDIHLMDATLSLQGTLATFSTPIGEIRLTSSLCGHFNLANIAVAVGVGVALQLPPQVIEQGISKLHGIPGRLEKISENPFVFVDYAHTPDALLRVLTTLKTLVPQTQSSRLIVVFGCGGDRDRSKRALMGEAASQKADVVLITSDNPRTENKEQIISDILSGISLPVLTKQDLQTKLGYFVEPDRKAAISLAIQIAKPGDVVLLAGKGHEDYQIIGNQKVHLDDREEAKRALYMESDNKK